MGYGSWFEAHAEKHQALVKKLAAKGVVGESLVEYFVYENMAKEEVDFCPLYAQGKKCHNTDYLNCFLCACPHFRFNDEGLHVRENGVVVKSFCEVNSRFSSTFVYEGVEHLDCSACVVPHGKAFVRACMGKTWRETMRASRVEGC